MLPQVERPGTMEKVVTALRAVLAFLAPFETQAPWSPLPYFGGWTRTTVSGFTKPGVRKDPLGGVELRGWVLNAAGVGTTIAVLEQEYRPKERCGFACSAVQGGVRVTGHVDIGADGLVIWVSPAIAANTEVSLSGIRFDTRV